ncbi:MAG: riboflavin synthase [Planctomycetes bacterium]|nr:riboflavin synthase [Planctomycetota bacterium]
MFTGLVEGLGTVERVVTESAGVRLEIRLPAFMVNSSTRDRISIGDSICINGCCLTAIEWNDETVSFQAGVETLSKTNLGELRIADVVNVERSLPVDGRLGGHFVQGHVDGVGRVSKIDRDADWITMWFEVSPDLARLMVSKGSVAVDGVSLTVVTVSATKFSVALIPHTLAVTTLGGREVGSTVNIETDILGKYVQRLLAQS